MSQRTLSSDDDDSHTADFNTESESKSGGSGLPLLQFTSVEPGGTVSNAKTVRSHAIKAHYQNKREAKKAHWEKLSQQRHRRLRPNQTVADAVEDAVGTSKDANTSFGTETDIARGCESGGSVTSLRDTSPSTPLIASPHQTELIPYAWFERDGPVLYVDQSKWPFPKPFRITASDRSDHSIHGLTPRQSHWMPYIRPPDVVSVKGAVLDPQVLLWIGQTPECFNFRVETIRWIQDQLQDPVRRVSNATIGAIMTFTMWTAGYGNPIEMGAHMDAVQRIVDMRGGFLSYEGEGAMMPKLTCFDSLVAVLTGEPLRFPHIDYYVSRPLTHATDARLFHFESPLHGASSFEDIIKYPKSQESITTLLNKMRSLVQKYEEQHLARNSQGYVGTPSYHAVRFIEEPQATYKILLLTLPLLSSCHQTSHNHVLESLQAAALIFSRSLACPRFDFPSVINERAFQKLCEAFGKCTGDDFWTRYPGVLLWVLLIGTASARCKKEAPFWMFYLSRTSNFSNAESWLAGSAALRRFVDLQSWGREGIDIRGSN